jgi:hypothetical protein
MAALMSMGPEAAAAATGAAAGAVSSPSTSDMLSSSMRVLKESHDQQRYLQKYNTK